MDRNVIQKILIGLFISACIFIGIRTFDFGGFNENSSKTEINTTTETHETN